MKTNLFIALIISIFSVTSVYADAASDNKKKDQEVLGILVVLNKNEIAVGKVIESKKVDPKVKDFAQMMVKQHGDNLKQTMQLSNKIGKADTSSSDAKSLAKQGKDELDSIKSAKDIQVTYIDDMVNDHQDALKTIDDNLMKNANDPALKKHLEATREAVATHLDKAKELQDQLKKSS